MRISATEPHVEPTFTKASWPRRWHLHKLRRFWSSAVAAGGWLGMSLLMLAFWGLLAVGVVALVRALRRDQPRPAEPMQARAPDANARTILDERFARGEIDADEYTRRRDLLSAR